ncbi:MAG: methionine synthase [Chloroflexia bacterium]|nr:methionine synthase [Chloroflexia bacterium]
MSLVLAGALGECVHVAGVLKFLSLAEEQGLRTHFSGPATPVESFVEAIRQHDPRIVGVSYRLTPETGESLLQQFAAAVEAAGLAGRRQFCFGGTPPVAALARRIPLFDAVFSGEEPVEHIVAYLRGEPLDASEETAPPQNFVERWAWKQPRPLIRHHFGLPTVAATVQGIAELAESRLLDVISIGPDQEAQENFFRPELQDERRRGAGGVPVRTADDLRALYQASRCGNYPLLRIYAGTRDLLRLAALYQETLHNAWAAIPLFWFNQMDGRGPMGLEESIRVHQQAMRWHAERDIPVESNEPHHWGMRDASDTIFVVAAYLAAYNAKRMGVQHYLAQYMFHSPPGLAHRMDLAKMLAARDLIETLREPDFCIYHQTRTGLLSYPVQEDAARAQLAMSIYLQMAMRPDVLHVVAFCEADHAAEPADIIASVRMARHVLEQSLQGQPALTMDPLLERRRRELGAEAQTLLAATARLAVDSIEDPLAHPPTLTQAVRRGLLDAPQLRNNPFAPGRSRTLIVQGACREVHPDSGETLDEEQRLALLGF